MHCVPDERLIAVFTVMLDGLALGEGRGAGSRRAGQPHGPLVRGAHVPCTTSGLPLSKTGVVVNKEDLAVCSDNTYVHKEKGVVMNQEILRYSYEVV